MRIFRKVGLFLLNYFLSLPPERVLKTDVVLNPTYQQWNVGHRDFLLGVTDGEFWHKVQNFPMLKGKSPVFMEDYVDFLHVFSVEETDYAN